MKCPECGKECELVRSREGFGYYCPFCLWDPDTEDAESEKEADDHQEDRLGRASSDQYRYCQ